MLRVCDDEVFLDLGLDPDLFGLCLTCRRTVSSPSYLVSAQDYYLGLWKAYWRSADGMVQRRAGTGGRVQPLVQCWHAGSR